MAAVDAGLVWLAVAGVIASVIGAFYYLRIVYLMYFGEAVGAAGRADAGAALGAAGGVGAGDGAGRRQPVRGRDARRRGRRDARAVAHGPPGRPGSAARSIARLDSTNAEALRRAAAGETGPLWILARAADRGARAARAGLGDGGGELRGEPADAAAGATLALRSFVAALGLLRRDGGGDRAAGALRAEVAERRAALGGQARGHPARDRRPAGGRWRSIGIGVNLARRRMPEALEPGAVAPVSLRGATGIAVGAGGVARPAGAGGGRAGRSGWRTRASRRCARPGWRGRRGSARRSPRGCRTGRSTGRFETIDATGALVLATDGGRVVLPAAEIHFRGRRRAHAARH